jgi:hypothetical protein
MRCKIFSAPGPQISSFLLSPPPPCFHKLRSIIRTIPPGGSTLAALHATLMRPRELHSADPQPWQAASESTDAFPPLFLSFKARPSALQECRIGLASGDIDRTWRFVKGSDTDVAGLAHFDIRMMSSQKRASRIPTIRDMFASHRVRQLFHAKRGC